MINLRVKTDKKRNYKIILEGYKNIEIDLNKIQKMVLSENILKVKDFSKVKYDIKELANQNNLKGVFINRILQKEEERLCTKEEAEQAIEIFINALKQKGNIKLKQATKRYKNDLWITSEKQWK